MDTTSKPAKKRRISLSDTKKAIEQQVRQELEAQLHQELRKLHARKSLLGGNSAYSISRYAENLESEILAEYIGGYNKKPTKVLPAVQEFEAQTRDRIVAQIAGTLLSPERAEQIEKTIAQALEAYIAKRISEAASNLSQQFLRDIMAKYETTKLLEVEPADEDGETQ